VIKEITHSTSNHAGALFGKAYSSDITGDGHRHTPLVIKEISRSTGNHAGALFGKAYSSDITGDGHRHPKPKNTNDKLIIGTWNCHALSPKMDELIRYLKTYEIDLLAIQELCIQPQQQQFLSNSLKLSDIQCG
jgi:hypothetical protein